MQRTYRLKGADDTEVELGFDSGGFLFAKVCLAENGRTLAETKAGKGLSSLDSLEEFVMPWVDISADVLRALREAQVVWEKGQQQPFKLLTQPYAWGKAELRFHSNTSLSFRKLIDLLTHCQLGMQQSWNYADARTTALDQNLKNYSTSKAPKWKDAKELRQYLGFVQQLVYFYQDQHTGAGHHDQWWRQVYLMQLYANKQSPLDYPPATFTGEAQQLLYLKEAHFSEARQQKQKEVQAEIGWEATTWDLAQLLRLEARASSLLSVLNKNLHLQQQDLLTQQMHWLHPLMGKSAEQQLFEGLLPLVANEAEQAAMKDIELAVWPQRATWKRYCLLLIALVDWATAYPAPNQLERLADESSRLAYDPWIKFLKLYQGLHRFSTKQLKAFCGFLWMGHPARAEELLLKEVVKGEETQKARAYLSGKQVYTAWEQFLAQSSTAEERLDKSLLALRRKSSANRLKEPQRYISKLQLLGCSWTNLSFPNLEHQGFVDNLLYQDSFANKEQLRALQQDALLHEALEELLIRSYGDAPPLCCPFTDERFESQCQEGSCKLLRSLHQLPNTSACFLRSSLKLIS